MKITSAQKSDYIQLMKLYGCFVGTNRYSKTGNDSFYKFLADLNSYFYLLKDKSKIVGFIAFSIRKVTRYQKPIAEIEELFIMPNCRNKGLGKKLIKIFIDKTKKIGCFKLFIGSEFKWKIAHKLYKEMGFKKIG